MKPYTPQPIDTSHIELSADLLELTELLAKNTHEVWATQRFAEGWKYGTERSDTEKQHPCLVTYEDLPEKEKEYDRNTAMETLKVIRKLGFRINEPQQTDAVTTYDVFISYSTANVEIADNIREILEDRDIRCWIAPRNIPRGESWPNAIVTAIENAKLIVLVFTESSNTSQHVLREVTQAAKNNKAVVPFLIEDIPMCKDLDYFLHGTQWLIGHPDYKKKVNELSETVSKILGKTTEKDITNKQSVKQEDNIAPLWKSLFKQLVSESEESLEKVREISDDILHNEGAESAIAFWNRLIAENNNNPLLYSGRAQLYERLEDTIENAEQIVKDFSCAYSLSTYKDTKKYRKLQGFYWHRFEDARFYYYELKKRQESNKEN